jgi:S1-C subfamily serine protease
MNEYASKFEISDSELNKLNVPGRYDSLLSAAKTSLKLTRRFNEAAFRRDFKKLFFSGMKILTLMPGSNAAEALDKGIEKGFALVNIQEKAVKKLYEEKKYGTALKLFSRMNPVPKDLKALDFDSNSRVASSKIAFEKAVEEEKKRNLAKAMANLQVSLSQWPFNLEAAKFYKEFRAKHAPMCEASETIAGYISSKEFQKALDKTEAAVKECPGYEAYFLDQRKSILEMRNEAIKNLQTANNYLKAGRFDDALKIYVFLDNEDGKRTVLEAIAEDAKKKKEWPKAIAALEKLGRWEEAGDLRKNRNIEGEVKLKKKNLTPAEIFNKCKSGVLVIKSTISGKEIFGSGFAVTKDGYLITNKHCITAKGTRASEVRAAHPTWSGDVKARIVKISDDRDLALLKINKEFKEPILLGDGDIPVGSKVFALGNPGSKAGTVTSDILQLTFTDGIVSAQNRDFYGNPCIQTTATINHGNSGGPLIDENCKAVGVNTFTLNDLGVANTFFAIKINEAKKCFHKELGLYFTEKNEEKKEKKSFFKKFLGL